MKLAIIPFAALFTASALAGATPTSDTNLDDKTYGSWGVDLSARDLSVRPGDDFDSYAGGSWSKRTPIPVDEAYAGPYEELRRLVQARLKAIIVDSGATSPIGALYRSFLDDSVVERLDKVPLESGMPEIAALSDKMSLARWMGGSSLARWLGGPFGRYGLSLFQVSTDFDPDDASTMTAAIYQGGLGLPDRDYYLLERFKPQREAYLAYIERALAMGGVPQARDRAQQVMAFESAIAKVSYSRADSRDPAKSINRSTIAAVERDNPGFPWREFIQAAGLEVVPTTRIIVREKDAIHRMSALYADTPIDALKSWTAFHYIDDASPYLSKRFVDSRFQFFKIVSGVSEQRSRERRAITLVDQQLGEAIGPEYARRYFQPAKKQAMTALATDVKAAMRARIASNQWLDPATRETALKKLDRLTVMVGYPDFWRDYSALALRPDDLFGNVARVRAFNSAYELSLLGKPVDKRRWFMTPQTVNAYNGGQTLQIVFPAARLQPPFFSLSADPAANYGAIGSIIGHEISHSFDNNGRQIDPDGRFREWWTPHDDAEFKSRIARLGAQYDALEVLPGVHINGKLTMGENIADLAGLQAALDAYHTSLRGRPAPIINGLTGDQRFFLAYAQARRDKRRDDALRDQVTSDEHAPSRFRVIGAVRNIDAWYDAFEVQPSDRYYLAPTERAKIW